MKNCEFIKKLYTNNCRECFKTECEIKKLCRSELLSDYDLLREKYDNIAENNTSKSVQGICQMTSEQISQCSSFFKEDDWDKISEIRARLCNIDKVGQDLRSEELLSDKLSKNTNAYDIFREQYNKLIMAVAGSKGLDGKTKQLIYIAMKASTGDVAAVKAHIPMAKQMGATKEEVVDAILPL